MGRGLSVLQQAILRLALHNRTAEGLGPITDSPTSFTADVHAWEVLESVYGFGAHRKRNDWGKVAPTRNSPSSSHRPGERVPGSVRLFSRDAIGKGRYNAAHVAVSKAFRRLEERKLAALCRFPNGRIGPPGLKLTAEGVAMAERLSAHSVTHGTHA